MTTTSTSAVRSASLAPPSWDAFAASAAGSTFCHDSRWADVFSNVFGHDFTFAWTEVDGDLDGILPLVRMPSMLGGHALVSLPYLNYGGALGSDASRAALSRWALDQSGAPGCKLVELRSREPVPGEWPAAREKVTVVLELPDASEALWDDLRSKVRSQVRRPMKEGMEVRFGSAVLTDFYDVFARNMRDLGTPVLPHTFFEALAHGFADEIEFAVVYHEDTPVAGGGGFLWQGEFEITWASSLRAYNRMAPNMLLYWSLMERVIEKRATAFNFGRCTPEGGTHRFKLQWGGEDEPLAWIGRPEQRGDDDSGGPARAAVQNLWRKLPLFAANAVGPILARRIPHF